MNEPSTSPEVLSVFELTMYIKEQLEKDSLLRNIWVRGEISNFKHHSRGHMYFTLKDNQSRVLSVMFAGHNRFLRFQPKDGLKVLVRGEISIYERDGQYQFYVKEMQPDGIGNLFLAYEQLKLRLQAEGLFAQKRNLPQFPKKIALITSLTGAVVKDMITTLKRRYPIVELIIVPVYVQGELAPNSISKGLQLANQLGSIDLIIVGRGGGSIEELWAFNDEQVARSIYNSSIPVISAVGHETDFTIADFVADKRAATPTAAAEIAVPHMRELREIVLNKQEQMSQIIKRLILQRSHQLNSLKSANVMRKPMNRMKQFEQRLDHLTDRIKRIIKYYPDKNRRQLEFLQRRLRLINIAEKIESQKLEIQNLKKKLHSYINKVMLSKRTETVFLIQQLESLSPLSVLTRGYTLSFDKDQNVFSSVNQVSPGDLLYVQYKDGLVQCTVWGIEEEVFLWDKKRSK